MEDDMGVRFIGFEDGLAVFKASSGEFALSADSIAKRIATLTDVIGPAIRDSGLPAPYMNRMTAAWYVCLCSLKEAHRSATMGASSNESEE